MSEPTLPNPYPEQSALHLRARWAGFFYVAVVVTGSFSLGYAPQHLFVGDTAQALAAGVSAQDLLLRVTIIAEALCYVAFAGLAAALCGLFRAVHAQAGAILAVIVLISVAMGFANLASLVEIQRLSETGDLAASAETIAAAHGRYRAGHFIQSIPWGLWLLPFGYLTIRSGFLPRLLGVGLILAGIGYMAHFTARLLMEGYRDTVWPQVFSSPRFAEILIAFWLLLFGARRTLWPARRATPHGDAT